MYKQWNAPCIAMFEDMAAHDPDKLIELVQADQLSVGLLTFAVESLGRISDKQKVKVILLKSLEHPSALVREGSIYGLADFTDADVIEALTRHSKTDDSLGVKMAAQEWLDSL